MADTKKYRASSISIPSKKIVDVPDAPTIGTATNVGTPEEWYGNFRGQKCVRTSYNGNIRKNYAGISYVYDSIRDAFIPPKPEGEFTLNEETCQWEEVK